MPCHVWRRTCRRRRGDDGIAVRKQLPEARGRGHEESLIGIRRSPRRPTPSRASAGRPTDLCRAGAQAGCQDLQAPTSAAACVGRSARWCVRGTGDGSVPRSRHRRACSSRSGGPYRRTRPTVAAGHRCRRPGCSAYLRRVRGCGCTSRTPAGCRPSLRGRNRRY